MKTPINIKTKKGMASFYVVIFTTLILSVIIVSFVRIIISETEQTSNNDLSQSAYDAALAGVEDAKTALLTCLNQNNNDIEACSKLFGPDCNSILSYISRPTTEDGAIIIKTDTDGVDVENQAYTCVTVDNTLSDYRSTLTPENRTRVVNLSASNAAPAQVRINWYSKEFDEKKLAGVNSSTFPNADSASVPPVIVAQIIQANGAFSLSELGSDLGDGTGQGTVVLYPSTSESAAIDLAASGKESSANAPYAIKCSNDNYKNTGFACSATVQLPVQATNLLYAHLTLPYGAGDADFSIELLNSDGTSTIDIKNTQFSVDSTGRANDLYRRVEARVELGDQYFPIPEYVAQIVGDQSGGGEFNKNFYATTNCWYADNGTAKSCDNYGSAS